MRTHHVLVLNATWLAVRFGRLTAARRNEKGLAEVTRPNYVYECEPLAALDTFLVIGSEAPHWVGARSEHANPRGLDRSRRNRMNTLTSTRLAVWPAGYVSRLVGGRGLFDVRPVCRHGRGIPRIILAPRLL